MLTVTILDENWCYAQGMIHLLQNYFSERNLTSRCFVNNEAYLPKSDIILKSDNYQIDAGAEPSHLERYLNVAISPGPYFFSQDNVLFRSDPMATVVKKLDKSGVNLSARSGRKILGITAQARQRLSETEIIVMSLTGKGKSLAETARILQKSIKTVSCQKRSAMRKLNLHNNYEYYDCIRQHAAQFELLFQMWWGNVQRQTA